jgi:hypothetical protein
MLSPDFTALQTDQPDRDLRPAANASVLRGRLGLAQNDLIVQVQQVAAARNCFDRPEALELPVRLSTSVLALLLRFGPKRGGGPDGASDSVYDAQCCHQQSISHTSACIVHHPAADTAFVGSASAVGVHWLTPARACQVRGFGSPPRR